MATRLRAWPTIVAIKDDPTNSSRRTKQKQARVYFFSIRNFRKEVPRSIIETITEQKKLGVWHGGTQQKNKEKRPPA
jgi:hypothetical protein